MTEAELKDELVKVLRYELMGAIVFRHEDKYTAGIPDISVTYRNYTLWIEVKYANPIILRRGLQTLTCVRLANQGHARVVIYEMDDTGEKRTIITHPRNVMRGTVGEGSPDECMITGFNHQFVVKFIRRTCGDNDEP